MAQVNVSFVIDETTYQEVSGILDVLFASPHPFERRDAADWLKNSMCSYEVSTLEPRAIINSFRNSPTS